MELAIVMLLAYMPFFAWMYKQGKIELEEVKKEIEKRK